MARRAFARTERLQKQIGEVVALVLRRESRDAALHDVVVTGCEVTRDLSYATIFYYLPERADRDQVTQALGRAAGFLRSRVGREIRARNTPELRFSYDESVATGLRVEEILQDIGPLPLPAEDEPADPADGAAGESEG